MSVLSLPDAQGLGTIAAESVLSIITRTADIYSVKSTKVLRLAVYTGGGTGNAISVYKSIGSYIGRSATVNRLVSGLSMLSGKKEAELLTLYNHGGIIGRGMGLVAYYLRVCPDCVHPTNGLGYGLLAHQLRVITHCPIHRTPLNEQCLGCGKRFAPLQSTKPGSVCASCGDELWTQHRIEGQTSAYAAWCEQQTGDFVAYATDPEQADAYEDWPQLYSKALAEIWSADRRIYLSTERLFVHNCIRRAADNSGALPSFNTLLRLASMQMVSLVDFIRSPVQCSSSRLLNAGGAKDPCSSRRDHPNELWQSAKKKVEALLESEPSNLLPSKRELLREMGLSVTGFWQHYSSLSGAYEQERRKRAKSNRDAGAILATSAATELVERRRMEGRDVSVRRDAGSIREALGVSKAVAERAIYEALLTIRIDS